MPSKTFAAIMALAAGATLLAPAATFAHSRSGSYAGYVTVQSRYGNGTITAPVREARYGYQIQLPGGTWWYCETSCAETLRRETVDFWETLSEESGSDNMK